MGKSAKPALGEMVKKWSDDVDITKCFSCQYEDIKFVEENMGHLGYTNCVVTFLGLILGDRLITILQGDAMHAKLENISRAEFLCVGCCDDIGKYIRVFVANICRNGTVGFDSYEFTKEKIKCVGDFVTHIDSLPQDYYENVSFEEALSVLL